MGADREARGDAHSFEFGGRLSAAVAAVARRLRIAAKDKTAPLKRDRFKSNLFFVVPAKPLGDAQILCSAPPPPERMSKGRGRKGGGCCRSFDNAARACADGVLRDAWCAARATPRPALPPKAGRLHLTEAPISPRPIGEREGPAPKARGRVRGARRFRVVS